jgi:hypothetical protein
MVWICSECKNGRHSKCESEWSCDCKCNIGTGADAIQKIAAVEGGALLAIGGIAFTVCTGGLGAVLVGGAMLGAGISSAWNGTEKIIKKERMDGKSYVANVAFGAVAGAATGGIGAGGEVVATNVTKEVAKVGLTKLAVRTGTGAVAGLASKAIDEVKVCSTTDKKWSDFGKNLDENGNENGTAMSWVMGAAVGGALGGASSHISSNVTKSVSDGVGKAATRVAVSATAAATSDALIQGANIVAGNQEHYDVQRTVTCATTSAILTTAQEGVKNAVYHVNGGKDNMLHEKTNKKVIEENVPEQDREKVLKASDNLKKIPRNTVEQQSAKSAEYTSSKYNEANHQQTIKQYDSQIQSELQLKKDAIDAKDYSSVKQHTEQAKNLIAEKQAEITKFQATNTPVKKTDIQPMTKENAHFLTGGNLGQVAVDVESTNSGSRGPVRATFDYDVTKKGDPIFKASGYTDKHDYGSVPKHGAGDYNKTYTKYSNSLETTNQVNNFMCNEIVQNEKEKTKKKNEKKKIN